MIARFARQALLAATLQLLLFGAVGAEPRSSDALGEIRSINLPDAFTKVAVSADGRWVALHGAETPGVRLIDTHEPGSNGTLVRGIDEPASVTLFDEDGTTLLVFERTEPALQTTVHRVGAAEAATLSSSTIDAIPSGASLGPNGAVFYADQFKPVVFSQSLDCLSGSGGKCPPPREFGPFATAIGDIGYSGPATGFLLVAPPGSGEVLALDVDIGKLAFSFPVQLQGGTPILATSLHVAAGDDRATTFIAVRPDNADQSALVLVADIYPSVRDWFPIATWVIAPSPDDEAEPHRSIGSVNIDPSERENFVPDLKIAATDDQRAVFVQDGPLALIQLRRKGAIFVQVDRLHASNGVILDFDVTADGRTLAILFPNELVLVPVDPDVDPFRSAPDRALVAAVQRKLSHLGFYVGGPITGRLSSGTTDGVQRFRRAAGLPELPLHDAGDLDAETLANLFSDDPTALPVDLMSEELRNGVLTQAFALHYDEKLADWIESFKASEFGFAGSAKCENGVAPPELWPNLRPLAVVLDELRRRVGRPLHLRSVYHTADYNDCVQTPELVRQAHSDFRAALIELDEPDARAAVLKAIETLRSDGYPIEGVVKEAAGIHVAVRAGKLNTSFPEAGELVLLSRHPATPEGCMAARADLDEFTKALLTPENPDAKRLRLVIVEDRRIGAEAAYHLAIDVSDRSSIAWYLADTVQSVARSGKGGLLLGAVVIQPSEQWEVSEHCFGQRMLKALAYEGFRDRLKDESECSYCPEMVRLPRGEFMMGSAPDEPGRRKNEGPQHLVTIARPFAVGKYEVTFDEWAACVEGGGCKRRPDDEGWGRGNRPVINVRWDDTQEYLRWLGLQTGKDYRLLTEAEWEYATRGKTDTPYWWGGDVGSGHANCKHCGSQWGGRMTAPVGQFDANPFGLYDVAGNVREWVEDCWHDRYDGAPTDGSAWTEGSCDRRVNRDGSWNDSSDFVRSAARDSGKHNDPSSRRGFRIARDLTQDEASADN